MSLALALQLCGFLSASAAPPKAYQVTGSVLEVTPNMVVVQKGEERWEIAVDADTAKEVSALKPGDKVTIHYRMTATKVEAKGKGAADKAEKTEHKAKAK